MPTQIYIKACALVLDAYRRVVIAFAGARALANCCPLIYERLCVKGIAVLQAMRLLHYTKHVNAQQTLAKRTSDKHCNDRRRVASGSTTLV